jgi:hypothetical protein
MDSLFPDTAALLRHRTKVQKTVQQPWHVILKDTPVLKTADELFKKMKRTTILISSTQKIPAIRFFLNALQDTPEIFFRRLDAQPFSRRMAFSG